MRDFSDSSSSTRRRLRGFARRNSDFVISILFMSPPNYFQFPGTHPSLRRYHCMNHNRDPPQRGLSDKVLRRRLPRSLRSPLSLNHINRDFKVPRVHVERHRQHVWLNTSGDPEPSLSHRVLFPVAIPAQWERPLVRRLLSSSGWPFAVVKIPRPQVRRLGLDIIPATDARQRPDEIQVIGILYSRLFNQPS
jgi:hypothetical protein